MFSADLHTKPSYCLLIGRSCASAPPGTLVVGATAAVTRSEERVRQRRKRRPRGATIAGKALMALIELITEVARESVRLLNCQTINSNGERVRTSEWGEE